MKKPSNIFATVLIIQQRFFCDVLLLRCDLVNCVEGAKAGVNASDQIQYVEEKMQKVIAEITSSGKRIKAFERQQEAHGIPKTKLLSWKDIRMTMRWETLKRFIKTLPALIGTYTQFINERWKGLQHKAVSRLKDLTDYKFVRTMTYEFDVMRILHGLTLKTQKEALTIEELNKSVKRAKDRLNHFLNHSLFFLLRHRSFTMTLIL